MGLLDRVKKMFEPEERLDISARFQLEKTAFTGTMSKFRVAREIKTGRILGLKILDSEKTAHFNSRFKGLNKPSEGEIGKKIAHKYVAATHEFGKTTTGEDYILMEFVDGRGLNLLIKEHNKTMIKNRLRLIHQMCHGLQAVHDAGFIHRDVCPRNFICNKEITALKLIDFGLTVPDEPPYKMPGNRTGTPQYMAPEVVRRRATDLRLDVFSLGVTVYRMLTFEHPWGSVETSGLAALAHDTREPIPILDHRPNLHPSLAGAVERCLQVNPEKRPKSVKHFLALFKDLEKEEA